MLYSAFFVMEHTTIHFVVIEVDTDQPSFFCGTMSTYLVLTLTAVTSLVIGAFLVYCEYNKVVSTARKRPKNSTVPSAIVTQRATAHKAS